MASTTQLDLNVPTYSDTEKLSELVAKSSAVQKCTIRAVALRAGSVRRHRIKNSHS
jgi:hypothetical protein